jgi:hypothetical protein
MDQNSPKVPPTPPRLLPPGSTPKRKHSPLRERMTQQAQRAVPILDLNVDSQIVYSGAIGTLAMTRHRA